MENLDSSILATALPEVARSLAVSPLHLSLALSAYLLGLAALVPASGWLADRYGARRLFRLAIVVFTVASAACGFAAEVWQLVLGRLLQGVGGAMMVPVGRLILLRRIPKHELVSAMAWITVPALVAPMIAPPLGGLIATYGSWRWIFWLNLPLGVLAWWLAGRHIPPEAPQPGPTLDWQAVLQLGLGLTLLLLGVETLGKGMLPGWAVIALFAGAAAAFMGFLQRSRRPGHRALLPLQLWHLPTFRASLAGGNVFRAAVGASSLLLPLMLQTGFGMTAAESGLLTCGGAMGALAMRTQAATIVRRFGFRQVLCIDAVASAALLCSMALSGPQTPRGLLFALFFAVGVTRSILFTSVNTMGYADVSERDMSGATSLAATVQQVATMLGIALASVVLQMLVVARGLQTPGVGEFRAAWVLVGLLSLASLYWFRQLPADAGSSVSGHRGHPAG